MHTKTPVEKERFFPSQERKEVAKDIYQDRQ